MGFSTKGIHAEGSCPVPGCSKRFKWNSQRGFVCPEHLTPATRYTIVIFYKGQRIKRGTSLDGKTLNTFAVAHALYGQAQREIETHRFDIERWKSKNDREYRFSALSQKWLDEKEAEKNKGRLAPSYYRKLKTYMEIYYMPSLLWNMDAREIRTYHIKQFMQDMPDKSPKYTKNISDALRNFFMWLKEGGIIQEMPVFKKIEVPEYSFKTISREDQLRILNEVPEEHKPIMTFLFYQGVRPSEARALKWKDISGETVTLQRTYSDKELREQTKNKRIRFNYLFPETISALPPKSFPDQFVFLHGKQVKRPYSGCLLRSIFKTACESCGIEIGLYEATKHSFATNHYQAGVGMDLLRRWFGHSSAKMTERYTRVDVVGQMRKLTSIK